MRSQFNKWYRQVAEILAEWLRGGPSLQLVPVEVREPELVSMHVRKGGRHV
jgi:hypothetical protein